MDETQGGAALEDETATVAWAWPDKLRDDVGEDVVPLDDRGVDAVVVGPTGYGMTGEH